MHTQEYQQQQGWYMWQTIRNLGMVDIKQIWRDVGYHRKSRNIIESRDCFYKLLENKASAAEDRVSNLHLNGAGCLRNC